MSEQKKNVVLIGMMGTFKTSAGKLAAEKLNYTLYDTDTLIEKECGMIIKDIFDRFGEEYFRKKESEIVEKVSAYQNAVISCGGGVVLQKENVANLKKNGIIILLKASPEVIYNRVKNGKHRPLINSDPTIEGISAIMDKRKALYEGSSDYIIDNSLLTSSETAEQIVEIVCQENKNSI